MTRHMDTSANLSRRDFSRRDFFGAAASLTLALTVAPDPLALLGEGVAGEALAEGPLSPNVWVTIATDRTIVIVSPAADSFRNPRRLRP